MGRAPKLKKHNYYDEERRVREGEEGWCGSSLHVLCIGEKKNKVMPSSPRPLSLGEKEKKKEGEDEKGIAYILIYLH